MEKNQVTILLVEDDVFLSSIYQKKFEMEGFKIVSADNGEKALIEAKKKKPSIILLDILLPKLDGFAVLERSVCRSDVRRSHTLPK